MAKFGGSAGMALSARFPVDADLSPFQAQVDEAVRNALVKFGVLRETENGKFEVLLKTSTQKFETKIEQEIDYADSELNAYLAEADVKIKEKSLMGKMMTRRLFSESMQTFNTIAQAAGWTKNQTYQMFSQMISGVVSLISTASLAASTWGAIPGGQAIAAWSLANAAVGFALQTTMQAQQSAIQFNNDHLGNLMDGID